MYELTSLKMAYLDETGLKGKDIWIRECKCAWIAFPGYPPIRSCAPPISIHEEREVAIVEQELAVQPFNMDRFHVFFSGDEIEGCVGLV